MPSAELGSKVSKKYRAPVCVRRWAERSYFWFVIWDLLVKFLHLTDLHWLWNTGCNYIIIGVFILFFKISSLSILSCKVHEHRDGFVKHRLAYSSCLICENTELSVSTWEGKWLTGWFSQDFDSSLGQVLIFFLSSGPEFFINRMLLVFCILVMTRAKWFRAVGLLSSLVFFL